MSRNFLQVMSLLLAQATGVVLAWGYMRIAYLQALAQARSFRPGAMLCGYDYFNRTLLAMILAGALAAVLAAAFWHCYDRLPERPKPEPRS
ncbi:hypothetical protein [Tahibacter harae]|uniref:Uncharacterized protein n=1 Tax=Tahibacter harae TaxID=2963937 RepID=A0ABT1QVN0_9GAMM|nr:hypothetical protein [Tahibacter harae]MCQ4166341.1 hypothetical protein [Tahibacter harae]